MQQNKISPNIWFSAENGNISKLIEYYSKIFGSNLKSGSIVSLGETPSGNTEICEVNIFGQKYVLLCTGKEHHKLNDSISFIISCSGQDEIDTYWNYFTSEGEESQCGWCIDKYGLRWQIVPDNMAELMSRPGSAEIMMKQRKIIIKEYLK